MASVLSSAPSNVFTKNVTSITTPRRNFQGRSEHRLQKIEIDISEVLLYSQKIDPNLLLGPDGISASTKIMQSILNATYNVHVQQIMNDLSRGDNDKVTFREDTNDIFYDFV